MSAARTTPDELERFRSDWKKEVQQKWRLEGKKGERKVSTSASAPVYVPALAPAASSRIPPPSAISNTITATSPHVAAKVEHTDDNDADSVAGDIGVGEEEHLNSSTEDLLQQVTQLDISAEINDQVAVVSAIPAPATAASAEASTAEDTWSSIGNTEPEEGDSAADPAVLGGPELSRSQRALKLYELAVEKERVDNLSDALKYYRQAFRLDDGVDKLYKNKHFPIGSFAKAPLPSTRATTSTVPTDKTVSLLSDYANYDAEPEDEDVPAPFIALPNEIINVILRVLALQDLSAFTKASYACKRIAYLAYSDRALWQGLCMKEYPRMNYEPVVDENAVATVWHNDWRRMFLERPRVMFNGIYISTCNYHRYGLAESWNAPFHIVTYYRYLRFYEDGTCICHLNTKEPLEIVPEFHRELMRRGMFRGTWSMTLEGRVRIESQAPTTKYWYLQELDIRSVGRARHNRLNWVGFWSVERASNEHREFTLHHEKPFYFSRVLSYDRGRPLAAAAAAAAVDSGGV
ncbi:uncharacterized protein V1518DRAFT_414763 [Limtongia smithiae]|uniref:uncharacterized protein n=1 Tax=Limtongia smithiae TaxID=1125753 RepID=UPI0034CE3788